MIAIPWLSLLLLKKEVIKRFMTATLVVTILLMLLGELAVTYNWWTYQDKLFPGLSVDVPFIFGAFIPATIWALVVGYGHPVRYVVINAAAAVFLAYPLISLYEYIDYSQLNNFKDWHSMVTSFSLALIAYWSQMWQDGVIKPIPGESPLRKFKEVEFPAREKAR
jgi:hypothetical protein